HLVELDERYRDTGVVPSNAFDPFPICFEGVISFRSEANQNPQATKDVIHKERDCSSFTKRILGFSPKEHREMIANAERVRLVRGAGPPPQPRRGQRADAE